MAERVTGRRPAIRALAAGAIVTGLVRGRSHVAAADTIVAAIPSKVREAATRVIAARWTAGDKSKDGDQDLYELFGEDAKGRKVIAVVGGDGKVTELRTGIPPTEVPKAAWEAVAKKFPEFDANSVCEVRQGDDLSAGGKDDSRAYEVGGTYDNDRRALLEVTADGDITDIEREIAQGDVPKAVTAGLKRKIRTFQTSGVFEISEDGSVVGYQFVGKKPKDKKEIDVFVSADGKEVEVEE